MGNTYTIVWWDYDEENRYGTNMTYWQGESFIMAVINFFKCKKAHPNCVRFEWR